MRLTLRTLLAYLDDLLDPAETKRIGQKLSESEPGQQLVARIKQVTRKRRLTTPPATGPGAFEPNTVAEYLDNTLPPEEVAEIERVCLESDIHLAEIASTHQILSLVQGQPAPVPPTARERMYGLVGGQNAVPARRARRRRTEATPAARESRTDEDDTVLGLIPPAQGTGLMRWALPLAIGGLALLTLGAVLGRMWPREPRPSAPSPVASANPAPPAPDKEASAKENGTAAAEKVDKPGPAKPPDSAQDSPSGGRPGEPGPGKPPVRGGETQKPVQDPGLDPAGGGRAAVPVEPAGPGAVPAIDNQRREVGLYPAAGEPSFLVHEGAAAPVWQRLIPGGKVSTADLLVSLPGYRTEINLEDGLTVSLWGCVPELTQAPVQDSAIVLHGPPPGFQADLTLDRGAVLLRSRNPKEGPIVARVRFLNQAWELTFEEPGTEIGLMLWGRHVAPFEAHQTPQVEVFLALLKGKASVKLGRKSFGSLQVKSGPVLFTWDNKSGDVQGPSREADDDAGLLLAAWRKEGPDTDLAQDVRRSLGELSRRLPPGKPLAAGLVEVLQSGDRGTVGQRMLAVRALGAINALPDLLNLLNDEQKPGLIRSETIPVLRDWIGRPGNDERVLFDPQKGTGLLIEKGYQPAEAATILSLLHGFGPVQRRVPETYSGLIELLRHPRLPVRELAYWTLWRLAPSGRDIAYDAAGTPEMRQRAYEQWKKRIPDGQLPPPPPRLAG